MRIRTTIPLAAVLLAFLFPTSPRALAAQGVGLDVGTPAPSAAVEDLEGNPVELADHFEAGKLTLIEFWATWCDLCAALQPQIDRIAAEYDDQVNVVAVAVAVSQSRRRVQRHLDDHATPYPVLWDAAGNAVRAYKAATTSIVVVIDGEGTVVYSGVGGDQDLLGVVRAHLPD